MDIDERREGDVAVLVPRGRLDAAGALRLEGWAAALEAGARAVLLDLSGVDYVSSMGVRAIVSLDRRMRERGGIFVLVRLAPFVQRVLKMAGLLSHLHAAASVEAGLVMARVGLDAGAEHRRWSLSGHEYHVSLLGGTSQLDLWNEGGRLRTLSLDEIGLAFGIGGLGLDAERAASGPFVAAGHVAGVKPAGEEVADFTVAEIPGETSLHVERAIAISGSPAITIHGAAGPATSVGELASDLESIAGADEGHSVAFVAVGAGARDFLVLLGVAAAGEVASGLPDSLRITRSAAGRSVYGAAFLLRGDRGEAPRELEEALAVLLDVETLADVTTPSADDPLSLRRAWIFIPEAVRSGAEKLTLVESGDGSELREEWRVIARRLHRDCKKVVMTPLHGGFMSQTFRVASTDREGRRQLPGVLKLGPEELTRREEEAHHRYVETFILNNSTTLLGCVSEGEWAGLRYNFLGISGPDSQLTWLLDAYVNRPTGEVLPLLERLYTRILEPWYGQPIERELSLFADHDPGRLFPRVAEDAEALLGVSRDAEILPCPELGVDLPNPFRFLTHEYPRRAAELRRWPTSVTHGDLNLRNVLLDERDNLYVIDFSETRVRSAVADLGRLEPIVKFELTRLDGPEDLAALLRFEEALQRPSTLGEPPPFVYGGDDPFVEKAHAVVTLLRRVAREVAGPGCLIPYWFAVLEWTYSVMSYVNVSPWRKRYAAYSAALICRRLMEYR